MSPAAEPSPRIAPAHLVRTRAEADGLRTACAAIFPTPTPLALEIGSGHGHFLTAYAAAHPHQTCLGVDLSSERIARANRKRGRARLPNLHFLQGEASMLLGALPPNAQLRAIFVLFPDPWPKRRHHKNRLIQPEFLSAVAARVEQGTPLYFRSDHSGYCADAEVTIGRHPDWRIDPHAPWPFELTTVFQARAPSFRSIIAVRR